MTPLHKKQVNFVYVNAPLKLTRLEFKKHDRDDDEEVEPGEGV